MLIHTGGVIWTIYKAGAAAARRMSESVNVSQSVLNVYFRHLWALRAGSSWKSGEGRQGSKLLRRVSLLTGKEFMPDPPWCKTVKYSSSSAVAAWGFGMQYIIKACLQIYQYLTQRSRTTPLHSQCQGSWPTPQSASGPQLASWPSSSRGSPSASR